VGIIAKNPNKLIGGDRERHFKNLELFFSFFISCFQNTLQAMEEKRHWVTCLSIKLKSIGTGLLGVWRKS
jgi:hypothetical protein